MYNKTKLSNRGLFQLHRFYIKKKQCIVRLPLKIEGNTKITVTEEETFPLDTYI